MIFSVNIFGGIAPRVAPRKLDAKLGQKVVNVLNTSGDLSPLNANSKIGDGLLSKSGAKKSIYRFGQDRPTDTDYWFHWLTNVNVVRGSIADDVSERTYFTGDGVPKMTYSPLALTGSSTNYPLNAYALGVPTPDLTGVSITVSNLSIVSITKSGTTATATTAEPITFDNGNKIVIIGASDALYNGTFAATIVNDATFTYTLTAEPASNASGTLEYNHGGLPETRVYAVTYVSGLGEEGAPSVLTAVNVTAGQKVLVEDLPTTPSGNYNLTKKRIYRTASGSQQSTLRYVGETVLATTTFTDTVKSTLLGENIPSLTYVMPPDDMASLIGFTNGMMAGISKNQVCLCVPYQPHAWPIDSRYSFNLKPIALGAFGSSIAVLTNGAPSILTGSSPQSMTQEEIKHGQPCLSAQSVIEIAGGVMWASEQGLCFIGNSGFDLATKGIFTAKEFKAYKPSSIRAYRWENRYVAFYDTGTKQQGFMFDTQTGDFVELNFYATAGFTDPRSGELYLAVGNDVFKLAGATTSMTLNWKSKVFTSPKPINMGYGKVVADKYPLIFKLYANGFLRLTKQVSNDEAFAMPLGYKAEEFELEITANSPIKGVAIAETVRELAGVIE